MSDVDKTRDSDGAEDVESLESLGHENDFDSGVVADDYDDLDDDVPDDDDSDDDLDDDDEEYEDASPEEIDFVVAMYREDGMPTVTELPEACANDLEELIAQLRRVPGDVGALGAVSINGEFFVLCRVRGPQVQVLLSDVVASNDWPIARDAVDFLNVDVPDPDDEPEPVGDLDILVDQGVSEFEMESLAGDLEEDSDELVRRVAHDMRFGTVFDKAIAGQ
ncbi:putative tRNA adenosine deaminase-associated protein [Propionibacterium cyclohexanicum]|uniref:Putative tRNA adenosine deaminase-associated protein n=1 Tax=Propionibacterium cyclohexanicum TaxID=64702 RepID=A0A1H9SYS7_9ACTN|nr:tRNA adenosine deaminase-associated protein [Propionibacterium cyclohexanicum]SER89987.1 putative tRNA adenosine deaminase-associated protein [Propionibacterium cyclohexanicum]